MASEHSNTVKETDEIQLSSSKEESCLHPPELPKYDYPPMLPVPKKRMSKINEDELSYLPPPMPANFYHHEGFQQKVIRKTKENPFVPIGALVTALVLSRGLYSVKQGAPGEVQNFWMRMRISSQGFCILAMTGGLAYQAWKSRSSKDKRSDTG